MDDPPSESDDAKRRELEQTLGFNPENFDETMVPTPESGAPSNTDSPDQPGDETLGSDVGRSDSRVRSSMRTRGTSGVGSGRGRGIPPKDAHHSEPIVDIDQLHEVLLDYDFVNETEWDQALANSGESPTVGLILDALVEMPAPWDESASLLTPYQREEIEAGRVAELRYDKYVVLSLLGEGGMGKVFKARHTFLDAVHALKTIRRDLFRGSNYTSDSAIQTVLDRFIREMRDLVPLDPKHFPRVHDAGEANGVPYYAMELVEGHSLDDMIKGRVENEDYLPIADALQIFIEVAEAMGNAHERGIIHRDLTPRNIMVTPSLTPKILDFGIARHLGPKKEGDEGKKVEVTSYTSMGQQVGSRPYMSPEQHSGDIDKISFPTDVYVLAATMFHVLTLKFPFPGETPMEVMQQHLSPERPKPSATRPDVPAALDEIIQKALSVQPTERYASMTEFREALQKLHAEITQQPPPPRSKWPLAVAATLFVGLIGGGAFVATNESAREAVVAIVAPEAARNAPGSGVSTSYQRFVQERDDLRSQADQAAIVERAQSLLQEASEELGEGERQQVVLGLLEAAEQGLLPLTTEDASTKLLAIVAPFRKDESSAVRSASEGVLVAAIETLSADHADLLTPLVADEAEGSGVSASAARKYRDWWTNADQPIAKRVTLLGELNKLDPQEARLLADAALNERLQHARSTARTDPNAAREVLAELTPIANAVGIEETDERLALSDRYALTLELAAQEVSDVTSAEQLLERIGSRAQLDQLRNDHQRLNLADPSPRAQAVSAIDRMAESLLQGDVAKNQPQLMALRKQAERIGVYEDSQRLTEFFGSRAFQDILAAIKDPNFDVGSVEQSLKTAQGLTKAQTSAIQAVVAVRGGDFAAAERLFGASDWSFDAAPWAQYHGVFLIDQALQSCNEVPRDTSGQANAAWLSSMRETLGRLQASDSYGLSPGTNARMAILQASVEAEEQEFGKAATTLATLFADLSDEAKGLSIETGELQSVSLRILDSAINQGREALKRDEDPTFALKPARSLYTTISEGHSVLPLSDDDRFLLGKRLQRIDYTSGCWQFHEGEYKQASDLFRELRDQRREAEFRELGTYWLLSEVFANEQLQPFDIADSEEPVIPASFNEKGGKPLVLALWGMSQAANGNWTALRQVRQAAEGTTYLSLYLNGLAGSKEVIGADQVSKVLGVYADHIAGLSRQLGPSWETRVDYELHVADDVPEDRKILRQLVPMTGVANGIAVDKRLSSYRRVKLQRALIELLIKPIQQLYRGKCVSQVNLKRSSDGKQYRYFEFPNEDYNEELYALLESAFKVIKGVEFTDPNLANDVRVQLRNNSWQALLGSFRLASTRGDWLETLRFGRCLIEVYPLMEEVDNQRMFEAFYQLTREEPSDEVLDSINQVTDPSKNLLPTAALDGDMLQLLERWRGFGEAIAYLNGRELSAEEVAEAMGIVESSFQEMKDDAVWEQMILRAYYSKPEAKRTPAIVELQKEYPTTPPVPPRMKEMITKVASAWSVARRDDASSDAP